MELGSLKTLEEIKKSILKVVTPGVMKMVKHRIAQAEAWKQVNTLEKQIVAINERLVEELKPYGEDALDKRAAIKEAGVSESVLCAALLAAIVCLTHP